MKRTLTPRIASSPHCRAKDLMLMPSAIGVGPGSGKSDPGDGLKSGTIYTCSGNTGVFGTSSA